MSENHAWVWTAPKPYRRWTIRFLCFCCQTRYAVVDGVANKPAPRSECEDCGDDYTTAMQREIGEAP